MTSDSATYPGHRFPAEIISLAVWLYHVFSLSLRDAELILAERGITVSHETIRQWCLKFGADFARKLRRRRPKPGDSFGHSPPRQGLPGLAAGDVRPDRGVNTSGCHVA